MGMTNIEIIHAMNKEQQPLYCTKKEQNSAVDEAVKALEKQTTKSPHTCGSYCPTCGTIVLGTANPLKKYCEFCGQRLFD